MHEKIPTWSCERKHWFPEGPIVEASHFLSGRNGAPQRATLAARHAKAESSFAHSKRCREVRLLLQTLRLRHGPRGHNARSLLPLCDETSKTVRRAIRSPRFKSTKK